MKNFLTRFIAHFTILTAFAAFLCLAPQAQAAGLTITKIGTINVTGLGLGSTLKTYTYNGGTFELAGTGSPSATVSIVIDDVTRTATVTSAGTWTDLISSVTTGAHAMKVTSNLESLSFTLNVGSASATATPTPTLTSTATTSVTTKGGLPVSGGLQDTLLLVAGGLALFGLGVTLKARTLHDEE